MTTPISRTPSVVLAGAHDRDALDLLDVAHEDVLVFAAVRVLALDAGLQDAVGLRDHDVGLGRGKAGGAVRVELLERVRRERFLDPGAAGDRGEVDASLRGVGRGSADRTDIYRRAFGFER